MQDEHKRGHQCPQGIAYVRVHLVWRFDGKVQSNDAIVGARVIRAWDLDSEIGSVFTFFWKSRVSFATFFHTKHPRIGSYSLISGKHNAL